jgi:hypothetical protein
MKCLQCGDRTFLDEEGFCSFKCEGAYEERERIIKLLTDLDVIRRDFFGHLVAFNTDGTEVVYLTGLEGSNTKVSGGDFPTDFTSSTLPISQGEK